MRSVELGGWALLAVALPVLGWLLPVYWVYLLASVAVTGIIARSIGLVTGRLGLITLCQMSFAAIGGWTVSALALAWPAAPFPLLVLAGGAAAAPAGLAIGLATARIRGVEFAIVTLGFAAALDLVLRQGGFPGVGTGTPVIPHGPFAEPRGFFALAWTALVLVQLALGALGRSRVGLAWGAVRSGERAAAALGVRVARVKALGFATGACIAGLGGGLLAGQFGLLTTSVFTPLTSMMQLVTAVLCGASLFGGAVLAGAFSVFLPELLRRAGIPLDVGNALLAVGAFDVLRRGRGGLAEQLRAALQDRAFARARLQVALGPTAPDDAAASPGPPCAPAVPVPPVPTPTVSVPAVSAPAVSAPAAETGAASGVPPRLAVAGLTVRYGGVTALDEVSLSLMAGEVHALVGPNGAGKSTFVDAVTGFLPEVGGTVALDGVSGFDALPARERAVRGVRRTFQHARPVDGATVGGFLRLAAAGRPDAGPERAERIRVAVRFLGLPGADVPVRLLDAGSRRVLEIAGALVAAPRAVLLDEPAAGLGEAERAGLAERVRRIPEVFDCAVLLIEHDMGFVRAAVSRATVLDDGRVIAHGAVDRALAEPRVIAGYLGGEA
ncbi:ATP-binding cassette domain-containing protein [Leucobacter allii]|uniref:ATP-binding cassette domain-containing protein n=1 Tax=Leucobacter allii TaxID=2932247 RepID=A0ABY4FMP3_9MICO|nr:ATP-binding cassette domain-containing protein [Leucobacter allii]UOQ57547.1 ATP-binding cassette domain-containing protein [Leucobacter allii]